MADLKNTYITLKLGNGGGSGSGVTPEQVQEQINSALTHYWDSAQTENAIEEALSGVSVDLSAYWTSAETQDYVDGVVSGISLEGYATSSDMQSAFTLISETQQVAAAGLNQLESDIEEVSTNVVNPCVLVSENIEDFIVDGRFKGGAIMFVPMQMYGYPRAQNDFNPNFLPEFEEGEWTGGFFLDVLPSFVFQPGYYGIKTFPFKDDLLNNPDFEPMVWKVNLNADYGSWSQNIYALRDFIYDEANDIGVYFLIKDQEDFVQYFPNPFRITGITWVDDHFEVDTEEVSTGNTEEIEEQIDEAFSAITETQDRFSAYTPTTGFSTINGSAITNGGNIVIEGGADMSAYYTSAQTNTAISAATQNMVTSTSIDTIWGGTQEEYDAATQSGATADPTTFYIIKKTNNQ